LWLLLTRPARHELYPAFAGVGSKTVGWQFKREQQQATKTHDRCAEEWYLIVHQAASRPPSRRGHQELSSLLVSDVSLSESDGGAGPSLLRGAAGAASDKDEDVSLSLELSLELPASAAGCTAARPRVAVDADESLESLEPLELRELPELLEPELVLLVAARCCLARTTRGLCRADDDCEAELLPEELEDEPEELLLLPSLALAFFLLLLLSPGLLSLWLPLLLPLPLALLMLMLLSLSLPRPLITTS
jgi:hypothetical protein